MKAGQKLKFTTPDLSFVSNPPRHEEAVFCRYGRKLKSDRFLLVWIENKGDHALLPVGTWYLVSICESQLV
jgi:hypothetical protein